MVSSFTGWSTDTTGYSASPIHVSVYLLFPKKNLLLFVVISLLKSKFINAIIWLCHHILCVIFVSIIRTTLNYTFCKFKIFSQREECNQRISNMFLLKHFKIKIFLFLDQLCEFLTINISTAECAGQSLKPPDTPHSGHRSRYQSEWHNAIFIKHGRQFAVFQPL